MKVDIMGNIYVSLCDSKVFVWVFLSPEFQAWNGWLTPEYALIFSKRTFFGTHMVHRFGTWHFWIDSLAFFRCLQTNIQPSIQGDLPLHFHLFGTCEGHSAAVSSIRFSPHGRWVATGGLDNQVQRAVLVFSRVFWLLNCYYWLVYLYT